MIVARSYSLLYIFLLLTHVVTKSIPTHILRAYRKKEENPLLAIVYGIGS
jgi:hypothetical protein